MSVGAYKERGYTIALGAAPTGDVRELFTLRANVTSCMQVWLFEKKICENKL